MLHGNRGQVRHRDRTDLQNNPFLSPESGDFDEPVADLRFYDATVTYDIMENIRARLSVTNVFDKLGDEAAQFNSFITDFIGRRFVLGLSAGF